MITPDQSTVLQGYCAFITMLATISIPVALYRSSKKAISAEYVREMQDLINLINTTAVASDDNLRALTSIAGLDSFSNNIEEMRKIWLAFIYLNGAQTQFLGMKADMVEHKYAERALAQILIPILKDEFVFRLIQERGYHPDFIDFCLENRGLAIGSTNMSIPSEPGVEKGVGENVNVGDIIPS